MGSSLSKMKRGRISGVSLPLTGLEIIPLREVRTWLKGSPVKRLHQRRLPSSCTKPHAAFDAPPEKRPNRSLSFTQFPRSSQKLCMFSTAPWTLLSSKFAGFGRSRLQRLFKRVDKRLTLTDTTIQAQSPTARCSEL